tara:strand:+ start:3194 stop:3661 length:468 start_codon:yes stop_codon:yes gene_type:complete
MGLTIGITGHTSGFGKHIANRCKELGHTVKGYSRATGYDLHFDVEKIFEDKMDYMINNAEIGMAQVNISIRAYRNNIKCINIGSKITEADVKEEFDLITKDNKITLEFMSKKFKQTYLTWGFTKGNPILDNNPELETDITIQDAVKEVTNELDSI